jgi:hypothetical protein
MALEKTLVVDKIEVLANGVVQVRKQVIVKDGDQQIAGALHRLTIAPGDDYSSEDYQIQTICAAAHTPDVIDAYKAATAAQGV